MKLASLPPDVEFQSRRIRDLENLLQQPSLQQLRPCPGCDRPCGCCHSTNCTCECSPDCEHAPQELSIDPVRYPIEPQIVSLVFAFNCLRIIPPYWSCEGHLFPSGDFHRVPQVWFYARSLIYPKLIDEYLCELTQRKLLNYPWHICLAYTDDCLETGFSIEPDSKQILEPNLERMQRDVQLIANRLVEGVRSLAKKHLASCRWEIQH